MARKKERRFSQVEASDLVVQPGKDLFERTKGQWRSQQFGNDNPIVLELACGRGEYTVGLAGHYPDRNFIGVDIKGDRIWKGCMYAQEHNLKNVAFLRCVIQNLHDHFEADEVDEIWIVHPDPRPKNYDAKRRLTFPRFLNMYKTLLAKDGWVRLKTDDIDLFDWSLETIQEFGCRDLTYTKDLYSSPLWEEHHGIVTRYEKMFHEGEGRKINYLKFRFLESDETPELEAV